MMIGNANKTIKSVISNIDKTVIAPLVTNAYQYVMRYVGDPDCKGDLQVVARGALSLVTKDAAQQQRTQFLAATATPSTCRSSGWTDVHKCCANASLDMNVDRIVPSPTTLALKAKVMAAQAQMATQQHRWSAGAPPGTPGRPRRRRPVRPRSGRLANCLTDRDRPPITSEFFVLGENAPHLS